MLNVASSEGYIIGDVWNYLGEKKIPIPTYSTLHKSEGTFFKDDFGYNVIKEATKILKSQGIEEQCDPVVYVRSHIMPEFEASQRIPECEKDVQIQA